MRNPYFDLIRAVWQYGAPWRKAIIGYYAAFVIAQTFLSMGPYAFGRTIDILQHFTPDRLHDVIIWLAASTVVLLLFWIFHGPARVKEREVALKIQQALRNQFYQQLTELPLKWHQNHHSGNIISRMNRACAALYRFAGDQFIYIETIIKFIVSMLFLLWISLPIGLLTLLSCLLSTIAVFLFDRRLIPLYTEENEIDNHVGAVLFDYISNMTTVLTLRLGELTRKNLWQRMMSVWPFYHREIILNEVKWFSMWMVLSILQSLILIGYIIHSLTIQGAVMIGTVVMIFRYQWELTEVFYQFSAQYSELVRMDTDVKGLTPLQKDIAAHAHVSSEEALAKQWHTIKINDLHFHHSAHGNPQGIFHGIGMSIKRGETIALIGESGGGKSTLLNIIRGLYQPTRVSLTIDDATFQTLVPLQAITTLVPQDPEIFENTIEFNVTMDVPATTEEIKQAIQLAGFAPVLSKLPNGLTTDIREKGLNLSVGQKQRLALARGLFAARYSSLILMDEPTSSVDLPTEKEILTNVVGAFPNATIMVSLHRLHLLPQFDRVIMLEHGKIIADGPTKTLLAEPGPVRTLWLTTQS